jgi:hypothetical protein
MRRLLMITMVCLGIAGQAQNTETRNIGSFSGVKVAEGVDVYLKKGDKESVKVEVTGTSADNVLTEVSGSYLKVHMRDGNYRHVDAKVYVTYVKIEKLSASSAGSIFSDGVIKADKMEITASSAGTVELNLEANSAEISASSAGDLELTGKCKSAFFDASSAGEIDAYDLMVDEVEVEASSAGSVKLNVSKSLEARASSGGSIRYRGSPDRNNTSSSSGGSVKKSS